MVTKQKIQDGRRWPPFGFWIFEILLNIKIFYWKQLGNVILYVKTMIQIEIYE